MLAATALVGAASAVAIGAPAQAAPSDHFSNVTGTTHLKKPNVDVAVPKSTVQTEIVLETNTVTGSANLADLTAKLNLANLIGVDSV
jgi:hypothetical protein